MVFQQHFFLVPSDTAVADAKAFPNLSCGQPLQHESENLSTTGGELEAFEIDVRKVVYAMQQLIPVMHRQFFSDIGKVVMHRRSAETKSLGYVFYGAFPSSSNRQSVVVFPSIFAAFFLRLE